MVSGLRGAVKHILIHILAAGINVCLLIQLTTASKGIKFDWMKVVTYTTFILASLFQSLLSYVTIVSSIHTLETPDDSAVWFGSCKSRSIQLIIIGIGVLNSWILDSCMVRSNAEYFHPEL